MRSLHRVGGSRYLDIILCAAIELQVRDVDDVMEACFVDSLSLISVCETVCVLVQTSDELACAANELIVVLLKKCYHY